MALTKADIKRQNDLMVVSCPKCKRETEFDTYQDIFDKWMGDISDEERTNSNNA